MFGALNKSNMDINNFMEAHITHYFTTKLYVNPVFLGYWLFSKILAHNYNI